MYVGSYPLLSSYLAFMTPTVKSRGERTQIPSHQTLFRGCQEHSGAYWPGKAFSCFGGAMPDDGSGLPGTRSHMPHFVCDGDAGN